MIINFNKILQNQKVGYVRKIISIKENEQKTKDYYYGIISDSKYYNEDERNVIDCDEGDYFVINIIMKDDIFSHTICLYHLVEIDSRESNNLHLLHSEIRISDINSFNYPYPENIFVDRLIRRNILNKK